MNTDLAQIDDMSDFSGSFIESPSNIRTNNYSPENRRFQGKTNVTQIMMNGEPRFLHSKSSPRNQKSTSPGGKHSSKAI